MTELERLKAEARKLYAGKKFYIKKSDGTLEGPREDIYYTVRCFSGIKDRIKFLYHKLTGVKMFKFVQVVNGTPVQAFTEDEIVVKQDGK